MENSAELLNLALPTISGLIFGLLIGFNLKKPSRKSVLSGADDETKLENEVLQDKVKQLEAKIDTLERAIEISN
ncbi:MAG: hypothetical protein OXU45_00375 [Candidatus Melainabacteria bacterium]|nr:hypothetical protein [Candidatus Melainabacteria bacterium]